jgi:glutathione S-transferase
MLKLFGRANSVNVQKVLWTCEELAIAVDREDLGGAFGGLDSSDYRRKNPNGMVPTIDDDGLILWESNTIVRYLAAKHGAGFLWPTDPTVRATSDKWMDWQLATFWPEVRTIFIQLVRTPEGQRNASLIDQARLKAIDAASILNDALAKTEFVAGQSLTIGDIATGVVAYRFFALDIERPTLSNLEAWYSRLSQRKAFARHIMLPLS